MLSLPPHPADTHINSHDVVFCHLSFTHQPSRESPRAASATHGNLQTHNQLLMSLNTAHIPTFAHICRSHVSCLLSIHPSIHPSSVCVSMCVRTFTRPSPRLIGGDASLMTLITAITVDWLISPHQTHQLLQVSFVLICFPSVCFSFCLIDESLISITVFLDCFGTFFHSPFTFSKQLTHSP